MIERDETLFAQQQVARLQALLEASRRIHSTIALDEVLRTVLQIVVRELELTGAFFTHFPYSYGAVPEGFSRSVADASGEDRVESGTDTLGLLSRLEVASNGPQLDSRVGALQTRFPLHDKTGRHSRSWL